MAQVKKRRNVSQLIGRWVRSDTKYDNLDAYIKYLGIPEDKARAEIAEPQIHIITAISEEEVTLIHQLPWRDGYQAECVLRLDGQRHPMPPALRDAANEKADWMHRFDASGLLCEQDLTVKGKAHKLRYWRTLSAPSEIKVDVHLYEVCEGGSEREVVHAVRFFDRIPFKERWIAAAAQFYSGMDVTENLMTCISWIRRAKAKGADLVVLPENSNRDRQYFQDGRPSKAKAHEMSESLDGAFVRGLQDICRELGIWCAVGVDIKGPAPAIAYIGQVLIRPDGEIAGVHKKHVLWDYEYTLFEPSDERYQVFDTELGRLGLLVCADGIVPEAARVICLMGAQVLVNSLNSRGPDELRVHIPLRAIENGVWHVASNSVGNPNQAAGLLWPWTGGSEICEPSGNRIHASEEADDMIVGEVRPFEAESKACSWTDDLLAMRRPELYGAMTRPLGEVPCAAMYGPAPKVLPFDGPEVVKVAMMQLSFTHTRPCTEWMTKRQISYASRRGAQLGVLPALWCFRRGEVEADPKGAAEYSAEVLQRMLLAAREGGLHLSFTLVEGGPGGELYHTAYLINGDGVVAKYRKAHLSSAELRWATPGGALAQVHQTSLGRLALMIGDEVWIPEVSRCLAVEGVEIVLHPADWDRVEAGEMAGCERSTENRFHLVSVTRLDCKGKLGSQTMVAGEYIGGEPVPLARYGQGVWTRHNVEEQVHVELLRRQAHCKMMGDHLDVLRMRFPDLYDVCTRPAEELFTWRNNRKKRKLAP